MTAELDQVPAGRYEAVIAHAEDAETRAEHYMRRLTLVIVGDTSWVGSILYAYAVDYEKAKFIWQEACENPRDLDVQQRFLVDVVEEQTQDEQRHSRVKKLRVRPGDDFPPHRESDEMEGEKEEPARRIRRESASRQSAVERDRERIVSTVETYLFEEAQPKPQTEPRPYADRRGAHGVAMPDTGLAGGQILTAEYARRFGAQLILAADLHDNLLEAGR
jgi:hypothetical protein